MGTSAKVLALVVAVVAISGVAAPAFGDDSAPPVILEWSAPPPCRDRDAMIRRVREIAGTSSTASGAIRAGVVIRATPTGFQADVDLATSTEANHRTLEGPSCDDLSDAVALVVALAINPQAAVGGAPQPSPPPPPDSQPATSSPAPVPPVPARAPPPPPPPSSVASVVDFAPAPSPGAPPAPTREVVTPRLERPAAPTGARGTGTPTLGLHLVVDGGTLPSLAGGFELAAAWRLRSLSLELDGTFLAPRAATSSARSSEGADFSMLSAGGRGCYAVLRGAVEAAPCLGVAYDWLFARGFGSQTPSNAVAHTVSTLAGVRVGARLTPLVWLGVGLDGVAPLSRPDFVVENTGLVYRPAAIALRGSGGVDAHF